MQADKVKSQARAGSQTGFEIWKNIWCSHIARKPLVFELPAWLLLSQADKIQKPSGKLAYQIGFEILEGYMAQTYSEKTSGFRASCMAFTIGWLTK